MKLETKMVQKLWGHEVWIDNNPLYCGKILHLVPGYQSSLHYHRKKTETFYVLHGRVILEIAPDILQVATFGPEVDLSPVQIELNPGDSYRLDPFTPHRFRTDDDRATILEVSTTHYDEDVLRLEDSRKV